MPKFSSKRHQRFQWIEDAVEREWYPLILGPKDKQYIHIIMEGTRWDKKLPGAIKFEFEIKTSEQKDWHKIERYYVYVIAEMFEGKSCFQSMPIKTPHLKV